MRIFHFDHPSRHDHAEVGCLPPLEGRRIEIRGIVQGVGFRPWVYRLALEAGVTGRVRNHTAGVTIEAFGSADALDAFERRLAGSAPPAAVIADVRTETMAYEAGDAFEIVESEHRDASRIAIPPDLATCAECAAELRDPANRRYRYAFTNCTSCGPRFTIAVASPYDRPNTTMAAFRMCPRCQAEYDSVADRRFHAQPNACPVCGPALQALDGSGDVLRVEDPIDVAAEMLRCGLVVALKGIGGFHLACDATSAGAVALLRERKRRDQKPFAVMARDLDEARRLAVLSDLEVDLLTSVERPIVLATRREPSPLAAAIAPRSPLVGLLLPYSPLHHLLMERVNGPLVMTSGNLSDEPIAYTNAEAMRRLAPIADLLIVHDREIVTRCDDSIARVIGGVPTLLRRSRGYVPKPVRLARPVARPVLGCGALLKNTFCMARGDEACLGPHIGDLENLDTYRSYRESISRLERFLGFDAEIVAHDLHPDYLSTQYAQARRGVTVVGVQHHHAHIASVMAEHGVEGPVIGIAYDGTGLGTDGTAWGGEVLVADYERFERVGTIRPIALAGGDTAIRQPWRIALALLDDAFGGDAPIDELRLFRLVRPEEIDLVRRMIRSNLNSPLASGMGRYFDAIGALALERPLSAYEGQVALEWNVVADPEGRGRYRYEVARVGGLCQIDLRPAVRDIAFELIGGEPVARVSARFHNTLAAATVDVVRCVARRSGRLPVALSGGCFQNPRLTETIAAALTEHPVLLHRQVPPGDGGLALGQAVVADAMVRGGRVKYEA